MRKNHPVERNIMKKLWAVGLVVIALAMAGCTSLKNTPVSNTPANSTTSVGSAHTAAPATAPATTRATTPPLAHVGSTISLKGENADGADVTVVQMIDPAQGADQYTTPDAGKRLVAVKLKVTATAGTVDDDMNNDVSIIGSDQQTYNATFDNIAGCTNFDSGSVKLNTGDSSVGCVAVQIPTGVTVAKVRVGLNSGYAQMGEWLVP